MAGEGLEPAELTDLQIGRFLRVRRDAGYSQLVSPRGVAPLVGYLRAQGAVPEPAPAIVDGPVEQLLAGFAGYLVRERGVSASTAGYYRRVAGVFLSGRGPGQLGVADLTAKDVTDFLLAEVRRSGGSVGHVAGALRSLLRFLHLQGQIPWPLAAAVPTGPGWHRPSSPRALPAGWVSRLLAGCDRRTTVGRRDYAILILLARLGLRAGEVAALLLADIDWRAGEIVVRGKGNRWERLPLPTDVGQALAGYLTRRRPGGTDRHVFLAVRAPHIGLSLHGVCSVVRAACARAGLPRIGAHRLRHTAATEIRRAGAPLSEVAQLLRHRRLATTAVYTSVDQADRETLRAIARPWPAGAR